MRGRHRNLEHVWSQAQSSSWCRRSFEGTMSECDHDSSISRNQYLLVPRCMSLVYSNRVDVDKKLNGETDPVRLLMVQVLIEVLMCTSCCLLIALRNEDNMLCVWAEIESDYLHSQGVWIEATGDSSEDGSLTLKFEKLQTLVFLVVFVNQIYSMLHVCQTDFRQSYLM